MRKLAMEELGRTSVEEFKRQEKLPVTLVLDSIRSMHNVGSVFRTADAFAVEKIILCGITGTPPHREIEKTALGATQSIHWAFEKDVTIAIDRLKQQGSKVLAIEQTHQSTLLHQFVPDTNTSYALIFGNEVNGVSDEALSLVDGSLEIPQFGTKHSFNVVVSAGIILWDFYVKLKSDDSSAPSR